MKISKLNEQGLMNDFAVDYERLLNDSALRDRAETFIASLSHQYDDLVSNVLRELREATSSDAGSIYIVDDDVLRFVYVQNELLPEKGDPQNVDVLLQEEMPCDDRSICGYVAQAKKPLLIDDVRKIAKASSFAFNDSFDRKTGYTTVSILSIPILDDLGATAGVLQLLNHKDEDGALSPFEDWMPSYVLFLVDCLFPVLSRSFEQFRRRSVPNVTEIPSLDLYRNFLQTGKSPDANEALPWLAQSGIYWKGKERLKERNSSRRLLSYAHYINQFEDVDTVMDLMLTEARDATNADAGTFYLVEGGRLRFAYVQNETLFAEDAHLHIYIDNSIPIDNDSIGGYAALNREILNIPDVRDLGDAPYAFNPGFDQASGYRTVSMLSVPILNAGGAPVAVLQLINGKASSGSVKPFDEADARYVDLLAGQTLPYLLRSMMTRRLINSMLKMSSLHDPHETAQHTNKVGAYAAEIYHRWAENRKIDKETLRGVKDILRLAAMLHDIGKIAISDVILKKPGKLTPEEFEVIKTHCCQGASVYQKPDSTLERIAYEITLHHHQRWDGTGYTGDPDIPRLSGEAIPIHARVTSVADVLDALLSYRVYKDAWTFEEAIAELKKSSGTHFDPEVVEAALQITDTLRAIHKRFT